MRKVLFLFLLISSINSFSQEVLVTLSTEWKKTEFKKWRFDKLKRTPYLNITYENNSNDAIYFLKVPKNFDIVSYPFGSDKKIKKDINYFKSRPKHNNEKFFVEISPKYWNHAWYVKDEIEKQNTDAEIEVSNNSVNEDLHDIYKFLFKDYKNIDIPFVTSTEKKITQENIITKLSAYFVFLKPGEKYIDSFDLTGFNILGGQYNFTLDIDLRNGFVETIFLENEKVYKKENLPKVVNGYKLFDGRILTNEINITF